jgi:hypothetical protein
VVTLDREPIPLTGDDQKVVFDWIDRTAQRNGVPKDRVAAAKSRLWFESTYPAYTRFVCGPAGTLLVQRVLPLRELTEAQLENFNLGERPPGSDDWDVFDHEGRYLGVAPLPTPPHRHAFTRDASGQWFMGGLERGDLDVPFASVWRIEGITD